MNDNVVAPSYPIKGYAKIEIIKDGKVIRTYKKDNAISLGGKREIQAYFQGMFGRYTETPNLPYYKSHTPLDMKYVKLLNVDYSAPNGDGLKNGTIPIYPIDEHQPIKESIAYVDRNTQTMGGSIQQGLINTHNSYVDKDKAVFVYDWSETHGVGTFNTILHHHGDESSTVKDNHSMPVMIKDKVKIFGDTERRICCDGVSLYRLNSTTSISEWDLATGTYKLISFPEGIKFQNYSAGYSLLVWKKDGYTYFYHGYDLSGVKRNDTTGEFTELAHVGNYYPALSTDGDKIYGGRSNTLYEFDFDLTLNRRQDVGLNNCVVYKGNVYDKGCYYMKLSDIVWGDSSDDNIALHKIHKHGNIAISSGSQMPPRNWDYYAHFANPSGWYFGKYISWYKSTETKGGTVLCRKSEESDGSLSYNTHEQAVWSGAMITKSNTESMRITYTFNFS